MSTFSDILGYILCFVVFWLMINSSSKRKSTQEYDSRKVTSCLGCDADAGYILCHFCENQ